MFGLIESGATHARKPTASLLSVAVHAALFTGAVLATHQIRTAVAAPPKESLIYVAPRVERVERVAAATAAPARLLRGFRILIAPISIPDVLPANDLTRSATNPDAYTGAGVPDGNAVTAGPDGVYTPDQVERVARLVPGTGMPQYPEALRSASIDGEVRIEFVVDTTGRADLRTLRVLASTHDRFTDAVTKALARARFVPAELGGRRVPQRVQMPFVFSMRR